MSTHRPLMTGIAAAAAAGVLAACGSGNGSTAAAGGVGGTGSAPAGPMTISTRTLAGIGAVLTNQSGRTLYTPQQEAGGAIKCTGGCLSFWFPVTVGSGVTPHATPGLAGKLGSVKRSDDGMRQLTYNGKPLYTFRLDSAAGQAHGNDFSDQFGGQAFTWHAVTSAGGAATSSQPASTPSNNPYQYGNSGY